VTPSNEHLVHEHVAERLAAAEARAERLMADECPERQRPGRRRRTGATLALSLYPIRKETPA
jgi:hypothetical protein